MTYSCLANEVESTLHETDIIVTFGCTMQIYILAAVIWNLINVATSLVHCSNEYLLVILRGNSEKSTLQLNRGNVTYPNVKLQAKRSYWLPLVIRCKIKRVIFVYIPDFLQCTSLLNSHNTYIIVAPHQYRAQTIGSVLQLNWYAPSVEVLEKLLNVCLMSVMSEWYSYDHRCASRKTWILMHITYFCGKTLNISHA